MAKFTQAQLDEARSNYARGVKSIQKGDERVEFRSLSEMRAVIGEMERELSAAPTPSQYVPGVRRV